MSKKSKLGFLGGALVGLGLGFLFAPKSGEETRKELGNKISELWDKVRGMDANEIKDKLEKKLKEIEKDLKELNDYLLSIILAYSLEKYQADNKYYKYLNAFIKGLDDFLNGKKISLLNTYITSSKELNTNLTLIKDSMPEVMEKFENIQKQFFEILKMIYYIPCFELLQNIL